MRQGGPGVLAANKRQWKPRQLLPALAGAAGAPPKARAHRQRLAGESPRAGLEPPCAQSYGGLDRFRLIAALLVIANHTSPLASYSASADYLLTHLRVTVPFFFMVTGFFLLAPVYREPLAETGRLRKFARKNALLYLAALLLYLPVNLYQGYFAQVGAGGFVRDLLFTGTLYHLWYLPASLLGLALVYTGLRRLPRRLVWAAAGLLFALGLLGDSYYGLTAQIAALARVYDGVFWFFGGTTRNGLFYAPLYLLLGTGLAARRRRLAPRWCWLGLIGAFLLMQVEGWLLRELLPGRHNNLFLFQPLLLFFLFQLLLAWPVSTSRVTRQLSMPAYLLHPLAIVLVRGLARPLGLFDLLVGHSLVHYLAVCLLTFGLAAALLAVWRQLRKKRRPNDKDRAWLEINLTNLDHNYRLLRGLLAPEQQLIAVIKADAYGHGALPLARRLDRLGVERFAVATLAEGIALRRAGIKRPILILGYTPPQAFAALRRNRLTQTIVDGAYAQALTGYGKKLRVEVKVDTGMHRLGLPAADHAAIAALFAAENLQIEGIFSHLARADELGAAAEAETKAQIAAFEALLGALARQGIQLPPTHLQSSYGLFNYPDLRYDQVRLGLALYSLWSSELAPPRQTVDLRPLLSLKARVALVRELAAEESVGYGAAFRAERPMRVAVVTIGYADGLPRAWQGGGVLLHGKRAAQIGRVCMDQLLLDVTEIPQAAAGDLAVLIGAAGSERQTACRIAGQAATIANEIVSRLGARLPRLYTEEAEA